jgi:hypothetical protein
MYRPRLPAISEQIETVRPLASSKDSETCSVEVRMHRSRGWSCGGFVLVLTVLTGATLAFATTGAAQPPSTATPTPGLPTGAAQPRPGAPPQPARDPSRPPAESATGNAVIRGRAVTLDSGQPLRRVRIFLSGTRARVPRSVLTDAEGRYEFKDLPADRYTVSADKAGFVGVSYGQRGPREPGRPLEVAEGQRLEKIDFHMPRGSVITGRIVDEFGEPMSDVPVAALAYTWIGNGGRRLMPMGHMGTTNDIGQYRLYGLPPGDYVVSATYRDNSRGVPTDDQNEGAASGYAPTFYPGTANAAEAQRVTLGIGQEINADMQMTLTRVTRVSGVAVDSSGQPVEEGFVQLRQRDEMYTSNMPGGSVAKGGAFTITGVPPGNYTLTLQQSMRPGNNDGRQAAFMPVTVGGEELTGLRLVMSSGGTLRGRVLFEGGQPPASSSFQVMCGRSDTEFSLPPSLPAMVREDGTFELKGLFGSCRVGAMPHMQGGERMPAAWTVKSVRQGGADITDRSIDVPEKGAGDVEILFTNQVTTLTGTVTGATAAPIMDYTVVAFPEDRALWGAASRRVRAVRPDQTGVFKATALPPGDYLVVAVERLESGSQWDPETLARLAPLGTGVRLSEGATQTVTVKLSAFP